MSKQKPTSRKSRQAARTRATAAESQQLKDREQAAKRTRWHAPSPAAIRETVESVVVAFVLAFLFRTFEAEAFVIPTGSMAPTLMGRHKDLECDECGYPYRVSASDEVDPESGAVTGQDVRYCTCPMCRYPMDLGATESDRKNYRSFKGDRILVGKFAYQFSDPERWDVAVFKYPGGAKTNFIKRLVGKPREVLEISRGDIFTCDLPDNYSALRHKLSESDLNTWLRQLPKTIARKPPHKLLAMLQPVFDADYAPQIVAQGWPARWRAWPASGGSPAGAWETEDHSTFHTDGTAGGEVWLKYRHLVPSYDDWQYLENYAAPPFGFDRRVRLISDFCPYNTNRPVGDRQGGAADHVGLHWVGDLTVSCTLEVLSGTGEAVFELVEGGRPMQCRIDLSTGTADLSIGGLDPHGNPPTTTHGQPYRPSAQTDVRGPGEYDIIFSNVDDQLRLWVNGDAVEFSTTTCYAPLRNTTPKDNQLASDLRPVGLGSRGAPLRVSHLKILRDIYYIARRYHDGHGDFTDFASPQYPRGVLSDPSLWEDAFSNVRSVVFPLEADQFLALGDNSAKSKDSRLWESGSGPYAEPSEFYVSRDLLIGKALYIYWPHSWDKLPGTSIPFPFFPNFPRMGFVR